MTRRLLLNNDFIKMNTYLYLKNIKSNVITGNFILVDIKNKSCSYLLLQNKFLWFKTKPKISIEYKSYKTLTDLVNLIKHNNEIEKQFKDSYERN